MRNASLPIALLLSLASLGPPPEAGAQSVWLEPLADRTVYLEILRPSLESLDLTFASTAWFLSGRWSLSSELILVAEVPFAIAEVDEEQFGFATDSEGDLGNIYLGVDWRGTNPQVFGELGVRLPVVTELSLATLVGTFADVVERGEAFTSDLVAIQAAVNYLRRYPSGFGYRLRGSPIADIPTEGGVDTELFLLYSAQGWFEQEEIAVGAGFGGRLLVTEDGDIGGRTEHQFTFYGSYEIGRFRPGLRVWLPVDDDLSNFVDLVFGLTVAVRLD